MRPMIKNRGFFSGLIEKYCICHCNYTFYLHFNLISFCPKVRWSDTDAYNHTNYSSYLTFAEDAVFSAIRLKLSGSDNAAHSVHLISLTEDIIKRGKKQLLISYQNESLEGQDLTVHLWQTPEEGDCIVRCSIERDDNKICQIVIEYFSN